MPKITRISTTVTARYSPANGAVDSFWLDGRMPGRRESRAADITLDREDKGFFFSAFATQSLSKDSFRDIEGIKHALEKTHMEIKHSSKSIDNQIPDLAECSVGVAGRVSVQHEGVRQPFFAGIIVKDSEIAAVTTGRGCAYLYRDQTLFPLTKDDLGFEPIDSNGNKVPNLEIYCAGVAGTVRYSHIAQLQLDDCIILCNREVIDAIGQKELLQILDDAYDQSDAAGMVITEAAAKAPGTPLQFMIGFVEGISVGDRAIKSSVIPKTPKSVSKVIPKAIVLDEGYERSDIDELYVEQDESEDEDSDEYYDDEYYEDEAPGAKKLAFIAVIAIILIVCGIIIYTIMNKEPEEDESGTLPTPTMDISESTPDSGDVTITPEPTEPTEEPTATPQPSTGIIATHTILPGQLLTSIANEYYGSAESKYLNAIVQANKEKYPDFTISYYQQGWVIEIPVVE